MLERVHADWIEGVLHQSLYEVARIELRFVRRADAVNLPVNAKIQIREKQPENLPPGTTVTELFDRHGRALLILGAPGAGKTTLLLELAEALLGRAAQDLDQAIPVVFNLSTWSQRRESLALWLISELHERSDVPLSLARQWVEGENIIPLLDGLDEVDNVHRHACVEAINQFRAAHGLQPIAICSRTADFEALCMKLRLRSAVVVQPLSDDQVQECLSGNTELAWLQAAAQDDSVLTELLKTPLMLWIAMLAYRDIQSGIFRGGSAESQRRKLFASFVEAMFQRRPPSGSFSKQETLRWLKWLAGSLQARNQSVFYLEKLQPDWLTSGKSSWALKAWVSVATSVVCALAIGLIDLTVAVLVYRDALPYHIKLVRDGLFVGGMVGLIGGTLASFADVRPADAFEFHLRGIRRRLGLATRSGLAYGWKSGLVAFIIAGLVMSLPTLVPGLRTGWLDGKDLTLLVLSFIIAAFFGIIALAVVGTIRAGASFFTSERVESRGRPNQGTWNSIKHAVVMLIAAIPVFGLTTSFVQIFEPLAVMVAIPIFLMGGWDDQWPTWLTSYMFYGLSGGLLAGLFSGGSFAISHLVLRVGLWTTKRAPLKYVAFLDSNTERLFLRNVGGGYVFLHRMLLEHFATLDQPDDRKQGAEELVEEPYNTH